MSRSPITAARIVLALYGVSCVQNGGLAPNMVMVMGQSYGAYGGGQPFQRVPQTSNTNRFEHYNFPKFTPYNTPGFSVPVAPPPPPPPAFGYRSAPPPKTSSGYGGAGLGNPFCESLQYLESDKSCLIPDSLFPVKGSCTEHLRCFRYRTGRIKPLPWKCPVGEIFSTISNQCEGLRKQDTFKEDYCPQIYCEDGTAGPKLKPTESPSYVIPIIPVKPTLKTLPPCPPPDDFLEFGPVQKCQPQSQSQPKGQAFGYGGYNNKLPPLFEAPTTKYPPPAWPAPAPVDEKYVGQSNVYQNEDAGVKHRPGTGQRVPLLPLPEQNPYLKPSTEGPPPPAPYIPAKVPHHPRPHKPVHQGGGGGHKEKEHEPTPSPPEPPGAGADEYTDYDEPDRGAARVPNSRSRNSATGANRLPFSYSHSLGLIVALITVSFSFCLV